MPIRRTIRGAAWLGLLALAPAQAADRIANSRFELFLPSASAHLPAGFGRHFDDRERSEAALEPGETALLRSRGRAALLVARPPGDPRGVAFTSDRVRLRQGHAYLMIVGYDPGRSPAECAFVSRSIDGAILAASSFRLTLLPDGRAFRRPLVPGPAPGPFLFPDTGAALESVDTAAVGDRVEAMLRVGPLPAGVFSGELSLGHGPHSAGAAFHRASLLDLSSGLLAVRGRGLGSQVVAAPFGVPLDPGALPVELESAAVLGLVAAPGETARAALALPGLRGPVELHAADLVRAASGGPDLANDSSVRASAVSLRRLLAPAAGRLDLTAAPEDRRGEDMSLLLELRVPEGTPEGLYTGRLGIHAHFGSLVEIGVHLWVAGANVTGNLVSGSGFESAREGRPEGWAVRGLPPGAPASDDSLARNGKRSLRLAHAPLEALVAEAQSLAITPRREARHLLRVHLRSEGEPAPAVVALEGVGEIRLAPRGEGRDAGLEVASVRGFSGVLLEDAAEGWLRLEAVADLRQVPATRLLLRSEPARELAASALHVDDLSLLALPESLLSAGRDETLIRNGGFERRRDGEPAEPLDWTVAAQEAPLAGRSVPAADLIVEGPVAAGRRAVLVEAGTGAPGAGLELRSSPIDLARGTRLELSFLARPGPLGSSLQALLRAFDRDGRPVEGPAPGLVLSLSAGGLEARPEAAAVALGRANAEGFHPVRVRVLDLPRGAVRGVLAFSAGPDAPPGSFFVLDAARVAPLEAPLLGAGLDLRELARRYDLRLWNEEGEAVFRAVFERLADLGIKPDVPTPESFEDFRKPFPSVAPPLLDPATAERFSAWAAWWWRRGFPAGRVGPAGEDLPRALEAFYAVWLPPLEARGLQDLLWAPAPIVDCIADPRLLRLEQWARALETAAPSLRRLGEPCATLDARERAPLIGLLGAWAVPLAPLEGEAERPEARLERRERGELLLADLRPYLRRMDGPPARPRAALWQAWALGFDGYLLEGLTRWSELPGMGSGVDGSLSGALGLAAAPGVLLWPGPERRLEPAERLLELSRGLEDLRLFRALESRLRATSDEEGDSLRERSYRGDAEAALRQVRRVALLPPGEAPALVLEDARAAVLRALAALEPGAAR